MLCSNFSYIIISLFILKRDLKIHNFWKQSQTENNISHTLRVIHTPWKRSAYKLILLNYLKIWIFRLKNDQKKSILVVKVYFLNFPVLHENNSFWNVRTQYLRDRSYNHCASEIEINLWQYKLVHNALKPPCCDVLSKK